MTLLAALLLLAAPAPLPAPSVSGVPGWFALGTRAPVDPREEQVAIRYGFLPEHVSVELVALSGAWAGVAPGASLTAMTDGGPVAATFAGAGELPGGCGRPLAIAGFDAAARPDGAAWLLTPEDAGGTSLQLPEEVAAADGEARAFRIGDARLALRVTEAGGGRLELRRGTVHLAQPYEIPVRQPGDPPLELKGDRRIGEPYPLLGLARGPLCFIVVATQVDEGVTFQLLVIDDGRARVEELGRLGCAP